MYKRQKQDYVLFERVRQGYREGLTMTPTFCYHYIVGEEHEIDDENTDRSDGA